MLRKRRRTLLADDDELSRAVLGSMLQLLEYDVDEVADGCEVVKVVSANCYDVIIMDLKMRPMDGVTASLLVRLKEQELTRKTPIIAVTASSPKECREDCLAAGINGYLSKPVDVKELVRLMESLLVEQELSSPDSLEPSAQETKTELSGGGSNPCRHERCQRGNWHPQIKNAR